MFSNQTVAPISASWHKPLNSFCNLTYSQKDLSCYFLQQIVWLVCAVYQLPSPTRLVFLSGCWLKVFVLADTNQQPVSIQKAGVFLALTLWTLEISFCLLLFYGYWTPIFYLVGFVQRGFGERYPDTYHSWDGESETQSRVH